MKLLVAGLVVLGVLPCLGACRHRHGGAAHEPMTPPAYDADAGAEPAVPGLPEGHPRLAPPAPSVSAQPGDVQL